jgi:glutamine amidotransferase
MRVAVVDYGGGNLASAARALREAARREGVDATVSVTADPDAVARADRIVLPGQGAFADCAGGLSATPGLRDALDTATNAGRPYLGICVGMQLMAHRGLESTVTPGFGWLEGEVAILPADGLRLPHMGWNSLRFETDAHALLRGIPQGEDFYFVHSYALRDYSEGEVLAYTDYGGAVPALVAAGNRAGTQFHVEKSQEAGLRLLGNFLRWSP